MSDKERRAAAGVPEDVPFRTKWEIALEQLDAALAAGVCRHLMLADAGYGDATELRSGIEERGFSYVVGVSGVPTIWRPGSLRRYRAFLGSDGLQHVRRQSNPQFL